MCLLSHTINVKHVKLRKNIVKRYLNIVYDLFVSAIKLIDLRNSS